VVLNHDPVIAEAHIEYDLFIDEASSGEPETENLHKKNQKAEKFPPLFDKIPYTWTTRM
jgi:hypothetical protein